MKKLFLGIAVLAITACGNTNQKSSANPVKDTPSVQTKMMAAGAASTITGPCTLDGLTFKKANEWIGKFKKDGSHTKDVISIWFSKDWVKQTRDLLDIEYNNDTKTNGFRMYFAKNDNNDLTLVVTATKDGPPYIASNGMKAITHQDFFTHKNPVTMLRSSTKDFTEEYARNDGTLLYTLTKPYPPTLCLPTNTNHVISTTDAVRFVSQFDKNPINTRSEWYDRDAIKNLDDELNAGPKNADGFRVYFAKDDDGFNMLVLVTTTSETNSAGVVYHKDDLQCYTKVNTNLKYKKRKPDVGEFDRGEKCPIYCNGVLPCDSCDDDGNPPPKVKKGKTGH
ncbi:MAG: hypothetical protein V4592_19145 [Bacteroidota bacterium]